jgi:hypothetical protein
MAGAGLFWEKSTAGWFWLVAGGWFVLREKYCWLVADKPSEQGRFAISLELTTHMWGAHMSATNSVEPTSTTSSNKPCQPHLSPPTASSILRPTTTLTLSPTFLPPAIQAEGGRRPRGRVNERWSRDVNVRWQQVQRWEVAETMRKMVRGGQHEITMGSGRMKGAGSMEGAPAFSMWRHTLHSIELSLASRCRFMYLLGWV